VFTQLKLRVTIWQQYLRSVATLAAILVCFHSLLWGWAIALALQLDVPTIWNGAPQLRITLKILFGVSAQNQVRNFKTYKNKTLLQIEARQKLISVDLLVAYQVSKWSLFTIGKLQNFNIVIMWRVIPVVLPELNCLLRNVAVAEEVRDVASCIEAKDNEAGVWRCLLRCHICMWLVRCKISILFLCSAGSDYSSAERNYVDVPSVSSLLNGQATRPRLGCC